MLLIEVASACCLLPCLSASVAYSPTIPLSCPVLNNYSNYNSNRQRINLNVVSLSETFSTTLSCFHFTTCFAFDILELMCKTKAVVVLRYSDGVRINYSNSV